MHSAASLGHANVIRLLASHGAKLNAATKVLSTRIEMRFAARALFYLLCFSLQLCHVFVCRYCDCWCICVDWLDSSDIGCWLQQDQVCEGAVDAAGRYQP